METSINIENIDIENEQRVVDERHLREIANAVKSRIEGLRGFGNIDGREGMNTTADKLQARFEAWWIGIHDRAPKDFQEIATKGY